MSPLRALLARPGAMRLAASSGIGWWAFNGYGLALVLSIHHATGSFAVAGASTTAFAVGSAAFAPLRGRAVDRGGAAVLLRLSAGHIGALGVVVIASGAPSPPVVLLLTGCALAGATVPPLTGAGRRAWARLAGDDLARTAHALNAGLGETAGLASPVVTSLLASASSPVVALAALLPGTAAAAAGIASVMPAPSAHRLRRMPASSVVGTRAASGAAPRRRSMLRTNPGLRWLAAGDLASGVWLGALEVAAPAFGLETSPPMLVGAPFAALAVGGIAATLWSGSALGAGPAVARYVGGSVGIALVMPVVLLAPTAGALTAACAAAGVAYGLANVALFELIDHVARDARATEAFTWITTAQASGLAIGAATAGALADTSPSHALTLACAAPLLGAAVAATGRRTLSRCTRRDHVERAA